LKPEDVKRLGDKRCKSKRSEGVGQKIGNSVESRITVIASGGDPVTISPMTTITLVFGALLTLIGLADFFYEGMHSPTLLFPSLLGILLIICSLVSSDPKLHRKAMKGAALVALFGFAATVSSFWNLLFSLKKITFATHSEMIANSATALLCLIFLTRCFQEFLVSRSRKKE